MPTTGPIRSRRRIFFRWLRYLLTGFLILLLALVCAGAIYEAIESHRDRLRFHLPGQLVDIDGFRLHLYCTGEGSPTDKLTKKRPLEKAAFSMHRYVGAYGFIVDP
jgi:hypothetical protein